MSEQGEVGILYRCSTSISRNVNDSIGCSSSWASAYVNTCFCYARKSAHDVRGTAISSSGEAPDALKKKVSEALDVLHLASSGPNVGDQLGSLSLNE